MSTLTPDRTLFPLNDDRTELGRTTAARPFGLSLSSPSRLGGDLDLTEARFDPARQVLVDGSGARFITAAKPTQSSVNTPYRTTHDHSSWADNKADTYRD